MKWENEWLMFALLGISTFLFQKKGKKGGKRKNSLGCHPSESWWREVDGKIVPGAARPYVDGLFVSVLKNAYAVQCTSLPPSFYRENEMALKLKEPLISPLAYIFDRSTYWRASLLFLKPQKTLLMTTLWKYRKSPKDEFGFIDMTLLSIWDTGEGAKWLSEKESNALISRNQFLLKCKQSYYCQFQCRWLLR